MTTATSRGQWQSDWRGPAIGLMDLDAFFASVEMLDHPEWRGKPVIVGGSATKRGVVSTASYEARKFGVHSAMPSAVAQRLCPQAIWTTGNYARYREVSDAVTSIIVDETPYVEQVSIDEAFFDVTPRQKPDEDPIAICRRIQERVRALGVTCSIGLGTSKSVAKIASERQKPRGLTVVPPGTEEQFLSPLPVRAMSGIGEASEARLRAMGIRTLGQIARCEPLDLRGVFGSGAETMIARAAGRGDHVVRSYAQTDDPKSVSNERTFEVDLTEARDIEAAIWHVSELTGARLRRRGLRGQQVTLKLKFDATHQRTAQQQLDQRTDDEAVFAPVAIRLLHTVWRRGTPVRLVGVGVSGFDDRGPRQLSLFDEGLLDDFVAESASTNRSTPERDNASGIKKSPSRPARDTSGLSKVKDQVRERFGRDALSYGRDLRLRNQESDTAPMNKPDF